MSRTGATSAGAGEAVVDRGLEALEEGDLQRADTCLEEARGLLGEGATRVLHLSGMLAWAQGDLDRALGFLMQAVDGGPTRADVLLDCAEAILLAGEDLDEAATAASAVLALAGASDRERDEARLTLAQVRLEKDDPEAALELLSEVGPELANHAATFSTRAAAFLAQGRHPEAVAAAEAAVAGDDGDADLQYQLALTYRSAGRQADATRAMGEVLRLDLAEASAEGPIETEVPWAQVQDLRTRLEDVLEDLPDPVLKLVGHVPITVQTRATQAQVAAGADPRDVIVFLGQPAAAGTGGVHAELTGLVIIRDRLLEEIEADDEIESTLFYALMDSIREFFDRDDLTFAEGEG
jgi:tetratricopeptide (TPR) repeat protein